MYRGQWSHGKSAARSLVGQIRLGASRWSHPTFGAKILPGVVLVALWMIFGHGQVAEAGNNSATSPGGTGGYCLTCYTTFTEPDPDWTGTANDDEEPIHRFDSSGSTERQCGDGDCHNNYRDGFCIDNHPPCDPGHGPDTALESLERIISKLHDAGASDVAGEVERFAHSHESVVIRGERGAVEILGCQGVVVAEKALPDKVTRALQ